MSSTSETKSPSRKTRANGRASRAAILDAAIEVFAERGYDGSTLGEIARRVGMTQPGLLHHFGTKDDLFLEVVRDRSAHQKESFDAVIEQGGDVIERLLGTMAEENLAARLHQQLFTTLSAEAIRPDHPAHDVFVNRYRELSKELEVGLVANGHPEDDAPLLAREILATVDGIHQQWLLDPRRVDLRRALSTYGRRLKSMIAAERRRSRR
jgi:AcrR family transcriptional regulator